MRRGTMMWVAVAVVPIVTGVAVGSSGAAPVQAIIDFESGLDAGDIVSTLDADTGISGGDFGSVSVFGERTDLPGVNQAMIFDATCDGAAASCSGEDADLFQPQLGNVLIISEDDDATDPDDADVGEEITFDFSDWGTGVVTVVSLDVLDVEVDESPGRIDIGGTSVPIPNIGDGNVQTLAVGGTGSTLFVVLNGSGAIDNIVIEFEPGTTTTTTAPTTTAPTTTAPTTTAATSTSTTSTTSSTTTTDPAGASSTTTSTLDVLPPSAPTTPPPTPVTELPATGGSAPTAMLASALLALGLGLVAAARRSAPTG